MSEANKKAEPKAQERSELQRVPCIHKPAQFGEFIIEALIGLGSKINTMHLSFARKQNLCICKTDIEASKIDGGRLEAYRMVIASFQSNTKDGKSGFFG